MKFCLRCDVKLEGKWQKKFCSTECSNLYKHEQAVKRKQKECPECGKLTTNKKFCSRSCSTSYNNRGVKRHGVNITICPDCGKDKTLQAIVCQGCWRRRQLDKQLERTLRDATRSQYTSSLKFVHVRKVAQRVLELSKRKKECEICGFDLVVHVCHIKPISNFLDETPLKTVNCESNLAYLCPNHHAMLDNDLLVVESNLLSLGKPG